MKLNHLSLHGKTVIENRSTFSICSINKRLKKSRFGVRMMKIKRITGSVPTISDMDVIISANGQYHVNAKSLQLRHKNKKRNCFVSIKQRLTGFDKYLLGIC